MNPTLSEFCTRLTGISQETVNDSPTFVEVLNSFQEFMAKYELFQTASAAFVTGINNKSHSCIVRLIAV